MTGTRRASLVLASGTVVSRLLGFANASLLAIVVGQYGIGPNAFALANQLPTYVYAIVAGGLLSAVLVPHIVRAATAPDGGEAFVNRLMTLGILAFLVTTIVATIGAPLIVQLYALGGSEATLRDGGLDLAIALAYWCMPQIFFYALFALGSEVLNARGAFGPAAWAPALNNVVMVATLAVFAVTFGVAPAHDDPATWDAARIAVLAGGATLGVALQAALLLAFWRRTGLRFRPSLRWRGAGLGAPARAAGWVFGMVLVVQATNLVQNNVATSSIDPVDPAVAVLRTTWLIFMLSHSIIAISIATPYFTRMSTAARDADLPALRADLSAALRATALLVTGAGIAFAAAAVPFARFFTTDDGQSRSFALVLIAFLVGLVPFSTLYLVQRAFYALGDTRTPFLLQVLQAVLFIGGALALLAAPSAWVAIGLAGVTSLSVVIQAIAGAAVLRARLGGGGAGIVRRFGGYALAGIPAAGAGVAVFAALGGLTPGSFPTAGRLEGLVASAAIGVAAAAVYLGILAATRAPELSGVLRRVTRR